MITNWKELKELMRLQRQQTLVGVVAIMYARDIVTTIGQPYALPKAMGAAVLSAVAVFVFTRRTSR